MSIRFCASTGGVTLLVLGLPRYIRTYKRGGIATSDHQLSRTPELQHTKTVTNGIIWTRKSICERVRPELSTLAHFARAPRHGQNAQLVLCIVPPGYVTIKGATALNHPCFAVAIVRKPGRCKGRDMIMYDVDCTINLDENGQVKVPRYGRDVLKGFQREL